VNLPLNLRLYVGLIVGMGVAAVTASLLVSPQTGASGLDVYYIAALMAMIAAAARFPIHITPKTKMVVDSAPMIAAVLLLPPSLAVLTCLAGKALGQAQVSAPAFQKAFNVATIAVQATVASMANLGIHQGNLTDRFTADFTPILATAVVLTATNVVIIEGIVSLQLRRRPFYRWWVLHRQELQHEASLLLLGVFGAVIAGVHPWTLLLMVIPTAVIYRSLRDGMQLQIQTRETVETLADIVDMRDHYTFEHSKRVAEMARELALALHVDREEAEVIYIAARAHDVGKIGIKGQILLKEGLLTEDEWLEMRTHPEVGAKLVSRLPEFRKGQELILSHHERYDGRGYPRNLAGDQIPLGARIISVVDAYDAMTSHRSYRAPLEKQRVVSQLRGGAGTQFDPRVVEVFLSWLARRDPDVAGLVMEPASRGALAPAFT
jgi:HD-GYP domain-containing protein (c-di-GMP phosphodiesterase class II)